VKRGFPLPFVSSRIQITVVTTLPTSTTNMTGFRAWMRGSSLRSEIDDRLP
jgi:hypothetical protein